MNQADQVREAFSLAASWFEDGLAKAELPDENDRLQLLYEISQITRMNQGDQVRFRAHGETGLPYELLEIVADECKLRDYRGRELMRVPVELLERADECSMSKS
jgi:hypothetical protein